MSMEDMILEAVESRRRFRIFRDQVRIADLMPTPYGWRAFMDGSDGIHASVRTQVLEIEADPEEVGTAPGRHKVRIGGKLDTVDSQWFNVYVVEGDPSYDVQVEVREADA